MESLSAADLRKQRDAIRHEMEQLVRTMQRLEPEVDQKRPGWESKRDELSQHRQKLSELRARMRSVMDAAAASAASAAASNTQTGASGGRQLFSAGLTSPPGAAASIDYHRLSPKRQNGGSPPHTATLSTGRHAPSSVTSLASVSASHALQELLRVHKAEKQRLQEEISRAVESLERRHDHERAELETRLQQEEHHLREYEQARQRMEEAQRHLEALKQQSATSFAVQRPREVEAESIAHWK